MKTLYKLLELTLTGHYDRHSHVACEERKGVSDDRLIIKSVVLNMS